MPAGIAMHLSFDDLTEKQREIVHLLLDDRSTKEIARIVGISPSAVEQRLKSIRNPHGNISRRELQRHFRTNDQAKLEGLFRPSDSPSRRSVDDCPVGAVDSLVPTEEIDLTGTEIAFMKGVFVGFIIGALTCCATIASTCALLSAFR